MSKGKIIAIAVVGALVALFFISPTFRARVRYIYDSANNLRYKESQRVAENRNPATGDDLAIAQQCRNRLQSAETAKRAIMNESGLVQAGNVVTHQQVADRLGVDISQLTCPKTGELYRLGGLADPASCSVGGNGTPTISADNHMIR